MSETIPTVTAAGAQPQSPASLRDQILAIATILSPGVTALPANLIADMSGTAAGAASLLDQAQVDAINSLTPFSANPFTLLALGQIYLGQGSTSSPATNTAVYVSFTGTTGFVIGIGFVVSDGTNQYTVQDGGVIATGGESGPLFCLGTQPGSWAVPTGSVDQIVSSVPSGVSLTCVNLSPGTPGGAAQTQAQYAAQVLQAGLVGGTGMPNYLKTRVDSVSGVQPRLVSVRQQNGGGWEVIVGGTGDPYQIGGAILFGLFDVSMLTGSVLAVTGISNANPGVVITNLNHGYTSGQAFTITGAVGISGINGTGYYADVLTETTFSIYTNIGLTTPHDTTGSGTWTSGGVVTPNLRNITVSLNNYPDTYTVPFVIPPLQIVTMTVTWNTISTNFVSPVAVAQLAQPALAAYINSIPVGAVINVLEMNAVFQTAVSGVLNPVLLDRLVFTVSINGNVTSPGSGTYAISGDPESYFSCSVSGITVTQG